MRPRTDLDFLIYPLAMEEVATCPACGAPMTVAVYEARDNCPDFSTFRCEACMRTEKFVFEN
jgi:transposase-like protein